MLTDVLSASLRNEETLLPTDCWTTGSRRTAAVNRFRAITVQMTMLIIRFMIFTWAKIQQIIGISTKFLDFCSYSTLFLVILHSHLATIQLKFI